jgi:leucyl/phenylalanyl-tRNA---protein transferase
VRTGSTSGNGPTRSHEIGRRGVQVPEQQLARRPEPVGPSMWMLPDGEQADEDGVVGIGADLGPATLVDAYRRGIFPWPHTGMPLPWFSPDPRAVIPLDRLHVSRSLRARLRSSGWVTTVDTAFRDVVDACATRPPDTGTWITPELARAYLRLHHLGWAHSFEVWDRDRLVGGMYGVQVGAAFTGESMFHRRTDASKVALVDAVDRLAEAGGWMLDVQLSTPHLERTGAVEVPRAAFLAALSDAREHVVRLSVDPRPVQWLRR